MIKVSIIIPVYNVEKYIEKCLQTIISQTLKEIEIIIINDGSTDNSYNIIKKYINKDNRIKYIYQDNSGVGSARNSGIKHASGEYIGFVDPDDFVDKDMFEKLYKNAKDYNSDISLCSNHIWINGKKIEEKEEIEKDLIVEKNINKNIDNFVKKYYCNKKFENHVWNKIFKRNLILNNNIEFGNLKEITGEDLMFEMIAVLYSDVITFNNKKLYNYNIRKNSIMNTFDSTNMFRTLNFMKKMYAYVENKNLNCNLNSFLCIYLYDLYVGPSLELLRNKNKKILKDNICFMLNEEFIQKLSKILIENKYYLYFNGMKRYFMKFLGVFTINKSRNMIYFLLKFRFFLDRRKLWKI